MGSALTSITGTINKVFPNPNTYTRKWVRTPYINMFKDLSIANARVGECAWKSSHNSVVGDVQIIGPASINILAGVLNQGCRVIELDMFEDQKVKGKPVVAHGNLENNLQVTPAVDFEVICKLIRDVAWMDTNEPLIVFLEMNVEWNNKPVLQEIVRLVFKYLTPHMFQSNQKLKDVPLLLLSNQVIFVPSVRYSVLESISYTALYGSGEFVNRSSNLPAENGGDKLVRVYAANVILSNNPDPRPFLAKQNQFVCMNWTFQDSPLQIYKQYFDGKGIKSFL